MRKVYEASDGDCTVKVHYSSEWNEYRVRLYVRGKAYPDSDNFQDYKCSAISTAKVMLQEERAWQDAIA